MIQRRSKSVWIPLLVVGISVFELSLTSAPAMTRSPAFWRIERVSVPADAQNKNYAVSPGVAMLSNGAAIVNWTENHGSGVLGTSVSAVTRSSAKASWRPLDLAGVIKANNSFNAQFIPIPQVVAFANRFLVTWIQPQGARPVLRAALFGAAGQHVVTETLSDSSESIDQPISLVPLKNGSLAVLWASLPSSNGPLCYIRQAPCHVKLVARILDRSGTPGPHHVILTFATNAWPPGLQAVQGPGGSLAVMVTPQPPLNAPAGSAYVVIRTTAGNWQPPRLFSVTPTLAATGEGTFLAAWQPQLRGGPLLLAEHQASGGNWTVPLPLPNVSGNFYYPRLSGGIGHTALLSWCQHQGNQVKGLVALRSAPNTWSAPIQLARSCLYRNGWVGLGEGTMVGWWLNGVSTGINVGRINSNGLSASATAGTLGGGARQETYFYASSLGEALLAQTTSGLVTVAFGAQTSRVASLGCCRAASQLDPAVASGQFLAAYLDRSQAVEVASSP